MFGPSAARTSHAEGGAGGRRGAEPPDPNPEIRKSAQAVGDLPLSPPRCNVHYIMHRTQILLEERQYEMLKARAEREGRSISDLVREAVDAMLGRARTGATRLSDVAGIGEDTEARGRDHDAVLYRPRREDA